MAPFVWSDGTCDFCREGLQTSCRHGGRGAASVDGGQGEAVRVPQAQGTLVKLPAGEDEALLASLLTLSDVFCTGHHAAVKAGVSPRTSVTVIGDGAVGLCAVLAARRLGAERIVLMGHHKERTDLGREFGATDVIAERGEEGIERVRELTGGDGTLHGAGVRRHQSGTGDGASAWCATAARSAGSAPPQYRGGADRARHVDAQHHPDRRRWPRPGPTSRNCCRLLDGTVQPGRVFDRTIGLDEAPTATVRWPKREALKVLIRP